MSRLNYLIFLSMTLMSLQATASRSWLDEVVVTAVKEPKAVKEVAATISRLGSDELATISHTHINEALQRVSGAWISRGNGQEHLTAIRSPVLTGAGSCGAFLMMQDGISLRAPGFCNVNELFESVSEMATRLEVQKGPGSDIYGSNALHGAVNVVTPEPVAGLRRLKFEAGPQDYYRTSLTGSTESLRLDLSGTTDGGYKDESGFDQQKLLLKHTTLIGKKDITTSLSYTNLNQETAGFILGDKVYAETGEKRDNPNPEAYRDARSLRLASSIRQPLVSGDLIIRPYLRSVEMEFLQHFLPGQAIEENGHDSLGLQTLWTSNTGNWRAGLEVEYTEGYLEESQPNPTSGSPFLVGTIPQGKHYDYDIEALLAGFFVQYQQDVTDDLVLIWGLRYQSTRYDYDNRMIDGRTRDDGTACGFGGCRFNRPADREDTFNDWSPRLGFLYMLSDDHQMYGSISRGFRAPQATELYRLQAGQSVTSIDSVELDALEVGFRGGNVQAGYNLSFFSMDKRNFIFRDTSRQNVDGGETRHYGLELDLDYKFNAKLSAKLAFTWAQHKYDNNPALSRTPLKGNEIDTAPTTLGSASLKWRPVEQTLFELEWVHIGSYYEDPQNEHPYEGHDLLHLRTQWFLSESTTLSARLMNLTDEDYAERADFGFGSDRYFVGTPLSLFLGLSINF